MCQLKNNLNITERWLNWQEGESYTYEGFNLPMVKTAINTWSIRVVNGKTLLTTETEISFKGGVFGRLLEPLMAIAFKKMSNEALAAFAYLVENDKPFTGKHSTLPRVATTC